MLMAECRGQKTASIPCLGQRRQHLVCANVATACNCVCTRLSLCASVPLGLCASEIFSLLINRAAKQKLNQIPVQITYEVVVNDQKKNIYFF